MRQGQLLIQTIVLHIEMEDKDNYLALVWRVRTQCTYHTHRFIITHIFDQLSDTFGTLGGVAPLCTLYEWLFVIVHIDSYLYRKQTIANTRLFEFFLFIYFIYDFIIIKRDDNILNLFTL